jgi:hypothetical protein
VDIAYSYSWRRPIFIKIAGFQSLNEKCPRTGRTIYYESGDLEFAVDCLTVSNIN